LFSSFILSEAATTPSRMRSRNLDMTVQLLNKANQSVNFYLDEMRS